MNSRRKFLSTSGATAGGLLLAPILSQIKAQAAGTKLPPRFVFLVEGNGLEPPHVTPIGYKRPNVQRRQTQGSEYAGSDRDGR